MTTASGFVQSCEKKKHTFYTCMLSLRSVWLCFPTLFPNRGQKWDEFYINIHVSFGNRCVYVNVVFPAGSLTESYDELGNRYQLPAYTLAPPVNLITETCSEGKVSESSQKQTQPSPCREEFQLRVRLSTGNKKTFCMPFGDVEQNIELVDPHLAGIT